MDRLGFRLNKTGKIILYLVFFVPLLIMLIFMIRGLFFDPKSSKDYFLEDREKEIFHGVIDTIFRQRNNHNIMTLGSKGDIFKIDAEWEGKFKIGDSISKSSGSILLEYYRENKLVEILDYRDLR